MSGRVLVLLMLVAGLVLTGCAPYHSSRTCEEISAAKLRAVVEETTSLEQVATRVAQTFHVSAKDVEILRSPDHANDGDIDWRAGGVHYTVIVKSSKVLSVRVTYESNPPSADGVIQCLGAPDGYWAFYYPAFESPLRPAVLNLYFPALGITCWGNKYGTGDRPPQLNGSVAMDMFDFVPLGPPDEVMNQLIDEGQAERIKKEMKPWPGDWRKVEVQSGYD